MKSFYRLCIASAIFLLALICGAGALMAPTWWKSLCTVAATLAALQRLLRSIIGKLGDK